MGIRTKILDKGKILQEQLIRLLIKFDERITALEDESGGSSYDDTVIKGRIKTVEDAIGDEDTADTILYRLKVLEDAQTPSSP